MHLITFILLIVGGLNWLAVGVAGWDVGSLFGGMDALVSRVIYVLVGLSTVYEVISHKKRCKNCLGGKSGDMSGASM
ncbi:MAG: DUF378 domain-containing protein [Patescibacteria group bacterium]